MFLGTFDRFPAGLTGQDLADAVPAVDERNRAGVNFKLRNRDRCHHPVSDSIQIPAQAQDPVRLMSPQIRLDQGVGHQPGIIFRHAGIDVDGGSEIYELLRVDSLGCVHLFSCMGMLF